RAIHAQRRILLGLWFRRIGRRAAVARFGARRNCRIAAVRLPSIGGHQHGDGGGGADGTRRCDPGSYRDHSCRRCSPHRKVGTARTWELLAVFLGSSMRLAAPLLLAGIGEMVSERAGVLNMSI